MFHCELCEAAEIAMQCTVGSFVSPSQFKVVLHTEVANTAVELFGIFAFIS